MALKDEIPILNSSNSNLIFCHTGVPTATETPTPGRPEPATPADRAAKKGIVI